MKFEPAVGDHIEFDSDRQTEKGPSAGKVTAVNKMTGWTYIDHSDAEPPGEAFITKDVKVRAQSTHHRTGNTLWILT